MKEKEMKEIASMIAKVANNVLDEEGNIDKDLAQEIRKDVVSLCQRFPMYADLVE